MAHRASDSTLVSAQAADCRPTGTCAVTAAPGPAQTKARTGTSRSQDGASSSTLAAASTAVTRPVHAITARVNRSSRPPTSGGVRSSRTAGVVRSEEHTSELQSRQYIVCRLLLGKKKKKNIFTTDNQ